MKLDWIGGRDRLRRGWPGIALLVFAFLPLMLSGPIRYVLHLSLGKSFFLATLAMVALVFPLRRSLRSDLSFAQSLAANWIALALGGFAAALLYNRDFHGVANYVDENGHVAVDAGVHVYNYMFFTRHAPEVYGGFVSMYGFWRELVHVVSLFDAINFTWLFVRFVVAVAPVAIAFSLLHRFRSQPRIWWTSALVCLFSGFAVQLYLVLPIENFYLMGGFWAQVLGLVPLFLLWMTDVFIRERLLRVAWMCALVALYRYTYGLNLADLVIVAGMIFLIEGAGRNLPLWARAGFAAAAFMAFCAAYDCWALLKPIFKDWGWIVRHDSRSSQNAQLLAAAACAATILWRRRGSGIARALRFPLLFTLTSSWVYGWVLAMPNADAYYLSKYDFHGAVLAGSVLVVLAVYWTALAFERFDLSAILGLVTVLLFANATLDHLSRGFASYDEGFREQAFGAPYHRSYPWVIPDTIRFIRSTLDAEQGRFGGYRASHVPMLTFSNALFDWKDPLWWRDPILDDSKGACIFWDAGHDPVLDQRKVKKMCEMVRQAPWGDIQVCSRCY